MFRETDSLFIPLDDILHSTSEYNETIFRLQPPSPSSITPESSSILNDTNLQEEMEETNAITIFFHKYGVLLIACFIPLAPRFFLLICTDCLLDYVTMIWKILFYIPLWLDQVFVLIPLQQIYRYVNMIVKIFFSLRKNFSISNNFPSFVLSAMDLHILDGVVLHYPPFVHKFHLMMKAFG